MLMPEKLSHELLEAFHSQGPVIKRKHDTHKTAEATAPWPTSAGGRDEIKQLRNALINDFNKCVLWHHSQVHEHREKAPTSPSSTCTISNMISNYLESRYIRKTDRKKEREGEREEGRKKGREEGRKKGRKKEREREKEKKEREEERNREREREREKAIFILLAVTNLKKMLHSLSGFRSSKKWYRKLDSLLTLLQDCEDDHNPMSSIKLFVLLKFYARGVLLAAFCDSGLHLSLSLNLGLSSPYSSCH
ncbi:hypothetical protein HPG69_010617 [Diceros bicornis minor]|uniref:Small ribosomal subunit protein uS7 domain-containing protein n=1 Tax=Diceros bicornis minor TaxID=77932 RepID=A0A7J7FGD5_DICBM|nr:hypothetical protein HPG69_010617 [Diceros bicornis minor]